MERQLHQGDVYQLPALFRILHSHPIASPVSQRAVRGDKEWQQKLKQYNIQMECWFPLGGEMSKGALFKDPTIQAIAKTHGKTPAQFIIRWHLQEGFSVIPGATRHDYVKENE